MVLFPQRLKELRTSRNLSLQELADIVNMSKSSVYMWETGEREPGLEILEAIADYFNVDYDYLIGKSDIPNRALSFYNEEQNLFNTYDNILPITTKRIPLLGEIACGEPIFANEEHEYSVEASADIQADFALKAKGDSMINARINDGDIVFIRRQSDVDNGEIAAVIIDDDVTLKRVYKNVAGVTLVAENPKYEPFVFTEKDGVTINILGKAVAFQSNL